MPEHSVEIMRVEIGGRWSCRDFSDFCLAIEDLYNLRLLIQVMTEDWQDWERVWFEMREFPPLRSWMKRRLLFPEFVHPYLGRNQTIPLDTDALGRLSAVPSIYSSARTELD